MKTRRRQARNHGMTAREHVTRTRRHLLEISTAFCLAASLSILSTARPISRSLALESEFDSTNGVFHSQQNVDTGIHYTSTGATETRWIVQSKYSQQYAQEKFWYTATKSR